MRCLTTQTFDILLLDDAFFDNALFRNFINEIAKTPYITRLIIYTGSENIDYLKWLINRGVRGIVNKKSSSQSIFEAVKLVYNDNVFIDERVNIIITKGINTLPTDENVTIKVYDILGSEIATLVNEHIKAGEHTVSFNAGNLSSGIYFYSIQAGKYSKTMKMILAK